MRIKQIRDPKKCDRAAQDTELPRLLLGGETRYWYFQTDRFSLLFWAYEFGEHLCQQGVAIWDSDDGNYPETGIQPDLELPLAFNEKAAKQTAKRLHDFLEEAMAEQGVDRLSDL